jgi:hypothetical protein
MTEEDKEEHRKNLKIEEEAYRKLGIWTILDSNIKEVKEITILDDDSRNFLLKWISGINKITHFDTLDDSYIKIPNPVEIYRSVPKKDKGYKPLCTEEGCFCRHDESKDKLTNYNGGVLGPVNFKRYFNNCSQIARKCVECGKKHPGHQHIKCKQYNELYDELENLALELGNHMMDCKEGSHEDLSALAHKIIKDLSKLI